MDRTWARVNKPDGTVILTKKSGHTVFYLDFLTCLHSLRHSAEIASSQQPSPTQPSDFLDTPGDKSNTKDSAICDKNSFYTLLFIGPLFPFISSMVLQLSTANMVCVDFRECVY